MSSTTFDDARDLIRQAEQAQDAGRFVEVESIYATLMGDAGLDPLTAAEVLTMMHGWALALYNLRRFADAEVQLRRALTGREQILGPDAEGTVDTLRRKLAEAIGEQGRTVGAEALAHEAVRRGTVLRRRSTGPGRDRRG
jgi:hypothetical protein